MSEVPMKTVDEILSAVVDEPAAIAQAVRDLVALGHDVGEAEEMVHFCLGSTDVDPPPEAGETTQP